MFESLRFGLWDKVVFKPDAPDPPDPYAVADAQKQTNIETAREQARLAMTGQQTPWGSVQYMRDPTSPSGYRAITNLSPEQQALLGQQQDLQALFGNVKGEQFGRVADTIADPFSMSAGRATELSDMHRTFLDPMWNQKSEELDATLMARGIRPGSEAYEREKQMFADQKQSAYNRMFLDAYQTANNAALTERNMPLQDWAMISGAQGQPTVGMPGTVGTPSPGVAPTDLTTGVYQAYGIQQGANNAAMSGLYGLGSAALSGWASAGFPGGAALLGMLSDRRIKTKVKRIDDDPRGWGIYEFEYHPAMGIEGRFVGFMVDEIEPLRPDAIVEFENGVKGINYDVLAQ